MEPKTHYLWASAGNDANPVNAYPGVTTNWQKQTWYAYNTVHEEVAADRPCGGHELTNDGARPRGIAFQPGRRHGVCCVLQRRLGWRRDVRQCRDEHRAGQQRRSVQLRALTEFPEPVQPFDEIQFTIAKAASTTLRVFDILGRNVATLVNENVNPARSG